MLPSDLSHLTPSQVDDLRRKLAAAGCQPPPNPGTISELHDAFALLRRRHGLAPSNAIDTDTLRCLDLDAGLLFGEVLRDELDLLRPASSEALDAGVPPDRTRLRARAHGSMLTGLALSGGGVRSATFGLGALQALARCRLLGRMDYLSTVSGGGFVGGWLARCLHAHGNNIHKLEALLAPPAAAARRPSCASCASTAITCRRRAACSAPTPGPCSASMCATRA